MTTITPEQGQYNMNYHIDTDTVLKPKKTTTFSTESTNLQARDNNISRTNSKRIVTTMHKEGSEASTGIKTVIKKKTVPKPPQNLAGDRITTMHDQSDQSDQGNKRNKIVDLKNIDSELHVNMPETHISDSKAAPTFGLKSALKKRTVTNLAPTREDSKDSKDSKDSNNGNDNDNNNDNNVNNDNNDNNYNDDDNDINYKINANNKNQIYGTKIIGTKTPNFRTKSSGTELIKKSHFDFESTSNNNIQQNNIQQNNSLKKYQTKPEIIPENISNPKETVKFIITDKANIKLPAVDEKDDWEDSDLDLDEDIPDNINEEDNETLVNFDKTNLRHGDFVSKMEKSALTKTFMLDAYDYSDNVWRMKKQTKIFCHHCCHGFNTPPVYMPVYLYDEIKEIYCATGVFCSFPCTLAYSNKWESFHAKTREALIRRLAERALGKDYYFQPAPAKECLKRFGGPISIEEYRNFLTQDDKYMVVEIATAMPLRSEISTIRFGR